MKNIGYTFIVTLLLSGCISHRDIAHRGVDFNLAHERTSNHVLLLNVVRAIHHHPMAFSGLTANSESITNTVGTGALTIPFGGGALTDDNYTISPSLTRPFGPTVSMSVYNDQKFYNGILKPLDLVTVDHYLRQGWDDELIFTLAVSSIIIESRSNSTKTSAEKESSARYYLTGSSKASGLPKMKISATLGDPEQALVSTTSDSCNLILTLANDKGLDLMINQKSKPLTGDFNKIELTNFPDNKEDTIAFQNLIRFFVSKNLRIDKSIGAGDLVKVTMDQSKIDASGLARLIEAGVTVENHANKDGKAKFLISKKKDEKQVITYDCQGADDISISFNIRSPQGILYYLGELARSDLKNKTIYKISDHGENGTPIFDIERETASRNRLTGRISNQNTDFGVGYGDYFYYVDATGFSFEEKIKEPSSKSTQVMSLLTQLFGLHHSGDKLPGAQVVNLIPR